MKNKKIIIFAVVVSILIIGVIIYITIFNKEKEYITQTAPSQLDQARQEIRTVLKDVFM